MVVTVGAQRLIGRWSFVLGRWPSLLPPTILPEQCLRLVLLNALAKDATTPWGPISEEQNDTYYYKKLYKDDQIHQSASSVLANDQRPKSQ